MHEISMLWQTTDKLPQYSKGSVEYVALLESFATHLRNLIEFLFFKPTRDYVRAVHFFDDPAFWPHTTLPPIWENLYQRACHEVNHLTAGRIDGEPASKAWEVAKILTDIEPILREFVTKAAPKNLHPKLLELFRQPSDKALVWIGENVSHSNVAAPAYSTITALSGISASTATSYVTQINPVQPSPRTKRGVK